MFSAIELYQSYCRMRPIVAILDHGTEITRRQHFPKLEVIMHIFLLIIEVGVAASRLLIAPYTMLGVQASLLLGRIVCHGMMTPVALLREGWDLRMLARIILSICNVILCFMLPFPSVTALPRVLGFAAVDLSSRLFLFSSPPVD